MENQELKVLTPRTEIELAITKNNLSTEIASSFKEKFFPLIEKIENWSRGAKELVITDISQKREMAMARTARLALKDLRVEARKVKESLKEESLRYNKAVDGAYNIIEFMVKPIEEHLQKQEDFEKRWKVEQEAVVRAERATKIEPYKAYAPFCPDLAFLTEEQFEKMLEDSKTLMEVAVDKAKKAEEEKVKLEKEQAEAKAKAEKEAQAKAKADKELKDKAENERLAKFAADKKIADEELAKKNKALKEQQDKLDLEKAQMAKVAAEQKAKQAELDKKAKELEQTSKKQAAPQAKPTQAEMAAAQAVPNYFKTGTDKEKLAALGKMIGLVVLPIMETEEGKAAMANIRVLFIKLEKYVLENSDKLETPKA